MVSERAKPLADHVVGEIRAFGGEAVASYENVATVAGGERIIGTAVETFGKVDILINNAGIVRDKTFVNMEEESWDAVMNVHVKGAYCVSQPAFKYMKEHHYGRIVMTASGAGLFGNFGQANYGAAKMALVGFTNVLRLEGERYGIKVNTVVPNAATRMSEGAMTQEMQKKLKSALFPRWCSISVPKSAWIPGCASMPLADTSAARLSSRGPGLSALKRRSR